MLKLFEYFGLFLSIFFLVILILLPLRDSIEEIRILNDFEAWVSLVVIIGLIGIDLFAVCFCFNMAFAC